MKKILAFLFLFPFSLVAQKDLDKPFKDCNMNGGITLYNANNKIWIYSNEADSKVQTNPASTFKIINALIALEGWILKDEKEIVKFIGIENIDGI